MTNSTPSPNSKPAFCEDPFAATWGFLWYNDAEIWFTDEAKLQQKIANMASAGITHIITFSLTHFRWSFRHHHKRINRTIGCIREACHRVGIRLIEHHSATLFSNPQDDKGLKIMKSRFACRNSSISNWPGFMEGCDLSNHIDGIEIRSMCQIDGTTGDPLYIPYYAAFAFCPNNPDFRRLYLSYLETVYETGIDGIMTDDVELFSGNTCTCPHCRSLFKSQTGFDLPAPGSGWQEFNDNWRQPAFLAWKKFRYNSVRDFHQLVKDHYTNLGLNLLRPNYMATAISWANPWAYVFDDLPALDWAYQENCFPDIIRYSWPEFAVESHHRSAIGKQRNIPAMSMYYPDREDTLRFSWAMALIYGHKYLGTTHNADVNLTPWEKPLREFENQHHHLLNRGKKICNVAFYDSTMCRELNGDYNTRGRFLFSSWAQACLHHNIPFEIVTYNDQARFQDYDLIILVEAIVLRDDELKALSRYEADGGRIIRLGETGTIDPDTLEHRNTDIMSDYSYEEAIGPVERRANSEGRWEKDKPEKRIPHNSGETRAWHLLSDQEKADRQRIASLITEGLANGPVLQTSNFPDDLLVTAWWNDQDEMILKLVNACGTLTQPEQPGFGHSDPIPFPSLADQGQMEIIVQKPAALNNKTFSTITHFTPENETQVNTTLLDQGNSLRIKLTVGASFSFLLINLD